MGLVAAQLVPARRTNTAAVTRAAGCLASSVHARSTTGTLRTQLIAVPGRLARSARRLVLHLPQQWLWQQAFEQLMTSATGPPGTAPR